MKPHCDVRILLVTGWICNIPGAWTSSNITMSTVLGDIFDGYDKKLSPKYDHAASDRQVVVTVNIFINSMFSVSEANMDYSMSMFLRERWVDERLRYVDDQNFTRLELDYSLFDQVWMPDMFILNEKFSNFHEVTIPNKMVHVYPDGTVQYSARVTGTFFCKMNLRKYPFDTQSCHFEVESYGHSTSTMKFVWSEDAVTIADSIEFPQFELIETQSYSCEKDYFGIVFPCIGVNIILKRNYAYYIIQIYIPSVLIVILSWVNFWLDPTSVPARISLGLLTVLTMTTQSAGARANLPRVSYVKAIDVYMATCMTFVFLGLVEYAYVNVLMRGEGKKPKEIKTDGSADVKPEARNGGTIETVSLNNISVSTSPSKRFLCIQNMSSIGRARLVDKISRFLFPIVFVVFNIFYWIYYMSWHPEEDEST